MDTIISDFEIVELKNSDYIKPFRIKFKMDGSSRIWDCVKVHDSVSILLYHEKKNSFLLVKQFRPAVWHYEDSNSINSKEKGYTYELCAGILDKGISKKDTAIEEVYEETGYKIDEIEYITSCYNSLGFGANMQSLFYAKISDEMKISNGGGVDGENIEPFFLPLSKAREFILDESNIRAPGLMFCFLWFFNNKLGEILKL